jgi:hypothetical protein
MRLVVNDTDPKRQAMLEKDMTSDTERVAGLRADFKVFYRRNGKTFFDVMWADTAQEAERKMLGFAKELRWKIDIFRVTPVTPDA